MSAMMLPTLRRSRTWVRRSLPTFVRWEITAPGDLAGRDPYARYDDLCRTTGQRHDPCLLGTFIAAVRFIEGEPMKPWWKYTAERKRELAARKLGSRR